MADFTHAMEGLGILFTYPEKTHMERIRRCHADLTVLIPEAGLSLGKFLADIETLSLCAWEECFTRTFDLNPICALEIGWHLFGEDYARGRFMARLRGMHRAANIDEAGELPDHLSNVLKLLAHMPHEDAADFVQACALPALEKILAALVDKENPYEFALRATLAIFHAHFQTRLLEIAHD